MMIQKVLFSGLLYYQTRWCKHIYAALWSMKHDEGNDQFSFEGRYQQMDLM